MDDNNQEKSDTSAVPLDCIVSKHRVVWKFNALYCLECGGIWTMVDYGDGLKCSNPQCPGYDKLLKNPTFNLEAY